MVFNFQAPVVKVVSLLLTLIVLSCQREQNTVSESARSKHYAEGFDCDGFFTVVNQVGFPASTSTLNQMKRIETAENGSAVFYYTHENDTLFSAEFPETRNGVYKFNRLPNRRVVGAIRIAAPERDTLLLIKWDQAAQSTVGASLELVSRQFGLLAINFPDAHGYISFHSSCFNPFMEYQRQSGLHHYAKVFSLSSEEIKLKND